MTSEQLDRWASEIRRRDHGTTHWDGCEESHPRCREMALIARVRELEAERDRLAVEVERLRVAARDFLDHHSLDCGAHYCRYCPARSPEWKHETYCAYVRAQAAYTALSAVLAEAPKEGQ